jgi:sugar lactone lactonase YvrE
MIGKSIGWLLGVRMPNSAFSPPPSARLRRIGLLQTAVLVAIVLVSSLPSSAMQGDTIADRVLGQADFTHNLFSGVSASAIDSPGAVVIDTSATPNHLYVSDTGDNRVLGYRDVTSFANGAAADLVIGQPDFVSGGAGTTPNNLNRPIGVAVDAEGNLYVSDQGNNRVLEYNNPFAACDSFPCIAGPANFVFGQGGSFTSAACNHLGTSADSLCQPQGMAVDAAGNLYVADKSNNRVLEYDSPLSTDTTADLVFGQKSFNAAVCADGLAPDPIPSAEGLCDPHAVAIDAAGNVYIADSGNNRVLEYNTPLSTDTTADAVFGQGGSFRSNACAPSPGAANLCTPNYIAFDSTGNLYIADRPNNRVLEYNAPISGTSTTADAVFGQGDIFTTNVCADGTHDDPAPSAGGLCQPSSVALDADGNLYIADMFNNRVLEYDKPIPLSSTPTPSASPTPDGAKIAAPSKVKLKSVGIGTEATSTARVVIKNVGKSGDLIGGVSLSNNQPGTAFTLSSSGPFDIPPHAELTLTVTFQPDATADSATIMVESNDPAKSAFNIPVTGSGLPGKLSIPKTLTLRSSGVGVRATANLILRNVGKGMLLVSVPAATPPFSGGGGGAVSIAPGKSSSPIAIAFVPTSVGTFTQTLQMVIDAPSIGGTMVTLKGTVKK